MAVLAALMLANALAKPAPCGDFQQQKQVPGMHQAFHSSGHYQLQGNTLIWQTLKPFASTLEVSPAGLYQSLPGQVRQQIANGDNPLVASLGTLLAAVMTGDEKALAQHFKVNRQGETLTLVPQDALVAKGISDITVTGQPPHRIRLDEPQGGQTLITLTRGQCQ
ncbi:outer membrane lipoprotein carrier protein LolA [Gallaecimonas mangrovi]|uniref:outer membrane lipoprotein carrier protein LolA n=1 Tax=Gallaecimonas mangrovi TaxID=2291597 RepID=UPI000E20C593|nr:outer membrane lipoprotein carrier protein LolA [Gallaecimonas mangrovi]